MKKSRPSRGSAILTAIWVIVMVAMLGFFMMTLCSLNNSLADKFQNDAMAFEAAQAGISNAMHELKLSGSWSSGFRTQAVPGSSAAYSISFGSPVANTPYYSVNNFNSSSAANGYFGNGTVPAGTTQIIAVGTSNSVGGRISRRVLFASLTRQPQSVFPDFAVFAKDSLTFTGNAITDAWDSSVGDYNATRRNSDAGIGTNGTSSGVLSLTGNVDISGDAMVGPGGSTITSISAGPNVTIRGERRVAAQTISLPNQTAPAGGASLGDRNCKGTVNLPPGTYGSLSASGNAVVRFSSGTYVFLGDVDFTGNSILELPSGGVTVYATTSWKTAGNGIVNTSNIPKNFILIGTSTCNTVHLAGNAGAYFGVYAPEADIQFNGNADIYGAVVGKTFRNVGNGAVHRDIDLQNAPPYSGGNVQLKGWQEI